MTNGQIAQLQDLSKCYLPRYEKGWVERMITFVTPLSKYEKAWLRRLTHQYRNQIKAIKRNQREQA
jgi:hypothetical protein